MTNTGVSIHIHEIVSRTYTIAEISLNNCQGFTVSSEDGGPVVDSLVDGEDNDDIDDGRCREIVNQS